MTDGRSGPACLLDPHRGLCFVPMQHIPPAIKLTSPYFQVSGATEAPCAGYRPNHTVMRKDKHICEPLHYGGVEKKGRARASQLSGRTFAHGGVKLSRTTPANMCCIKVHQVHHAAWPSILLCIFLSFYSSVKTFLYYFTRLPI